MKYVAWQTEALSAMQTPLLDIWLVKYKSLQHSLVSFPFHGPMRWSHKIFNKGCLNREIARRLITGVVRVCNNLQTLPTNN